MFRILAECSKVEVDDALSLAIEKVKEMQNSGQLSGIAGSIKIPDFINGGMLKMLPKDKKMELMEQSMHQEKSRIMAMLQPAISRVIGPVQILDFQMKAMPAAGLDATMRVDVEIQDADRVIEKTTEAVERQRDDSVIYAQHEEELVAEDAEAEIDEDFDEGSVDIGEEESSTDIGSDETLIEEEEF